MFHSSPSSPFSSEATAAPPAYLREIQQQVGSGHPSGAAAAILSLQQPSVAQQSQPPSSAPPPGSEPQSVMHQNPKRPRMSYGHHASSPMSHGSGHMVIPPGAAGPSSGGLSEPLRIDTSSAKVGQLF